MPLNTKCNLTVSWPSRPFNFIVIKKQTKLSKKELFPFLQQCYICCTPQLRAWFSCLFRIKANSNTSVSYYFKGKESKLMGIGGQLSEFELNGCNWRSVSRVRFLLGYTEDFDPGQAQTQKFPSSNFWQADAQGPPYKSEHLYVLQSAAFVHFV